MGASADFCADVKPLTINYFTSMILQKRGNCNGVSCEHVTYDHTAAVERKNKVVAALVNGVAAAMRMHHVEVIPENAVIAGRDDAPNCRLTRNTMSAWSPHICPAVLLPKNG